MRLNWLQCRFEKMITIVNNHKMRGEQLKLQVRMKKVIQLKIVGIIIKEEKNLVGLVFLFFNLKNRTKLNIQFFSKSTNETKLIN